MRKNLKVKLTLILLVLLFFGFLYFLFSEKKPPKPLLKCELLAENCQDKSCKYYFLCSGKNYQKCTVYKCDGKFKVEAITKEGKKESFSRPQPQREKIEKLINACKNSEVTFLEKKCEKGTLKVKLKIKSQKDCPAQAFLAKKEKKYLPVNSEKENEVFSLTIKNCEIDSIIVIGPAGVKMKEVKIK